MFHCRYIIVGHYVIRTSPVSSRFGLSPIGRTLISLVVQPLRRSAAFRTDEFRVTEATQTDRIMLSFIGGTLTHFWSGVIVPQFFELSLNSTNLCTSNSCSLFFCFVLSTASRADDYILGFVCLFVRMCVISLVSKTSQKLFYGSLLNL